MKHIFKRSLFSILCLLMCLGLTWSCTEDEAVYSGEVKLLSFGPSGVKPGEPISFIGKNLDKVTSVELTGASVAKSAFTKHTAELIQLNVPIQTAEGLVTLKTTEGDIVSKTKLSFEVAVKIESVPVQARPGENITIKGQYLNWVKSIHFAKDTTVVKFVSQSLTELVVTVPVGAETGPLVFSTGGTEPLSIETEKELIVSLPAVTSIAPIPAERGKNLTIKGTNLDLVAGVLFKGLTAPVTEFVSKSATQIELTIPKAATKGKVSVVAYSKIAIEAPVALTFTDDLPDLPALKYAMYEDALVSPWQNWGWGNTADFVNSDNVRDGEKSAKVTFSGGWGALKLANGSVATATYSEITFAIFATAGTGGKKINVSANGGTAYVITLEEGKWVEYKLTKANLGSPVTITDLAMQETGWSGTIYLDHVGLR